MEEKSIYVAIKYNCGEFKYAQSKFLLYRVLVGNENLIFNTGIGI